MTPDHARQPGQCALVADGTTDRLPGFAGRRNNISTVRLLGLSLRPRADRTTRPLRRKRYVIVLGAILLSVQRASASDMTGALVLVPIAGGVIGLAIGAAICALVCSMRTGRRMIWFSLPIYGVAGVAV